MLATITRYCSKIYTKTNLIYNQQPFVRRISFELPEKYKGTIIEKWHMYWKGLFKDYKDVCIDTMKDIREKPLKATIIFSIMGFSTYAAKNNPDKTNYRNTVLNYNNDILTLGEDVRSEYAVNYLKNLEKYFNCGLIRRLNLGLFSLIWHDKFPKECGLYEAQCSFTQPSYLEFHKRVIDIGFLNKWWIIHRELTDYDVNEKEWQ